MSDKQITPLAVVTITVIARPDAAQSVVDDFRCIAGDGVLAWEVSMLDTIDYNIPAEDAEK